MEFKEFIESNLNIINSKYKKDIDVISAKYTLCFVEIHKLFTTEEIESGKKLFNPIFIDHCIIGNKDISFYLHDGFKNKKSFYSFEKNAIVINFRHIGIHENVVDQFRRIIEHELGHSISYRTSQQGIAKELYKKLDDEEFDAICTQMAGDIKRIIAKNPMKQVDFESWFHSGKILESLPSELNLYKDYITKISKDPIKYKKFIDRFYNYIFHNKTSKNNH